MKCQPTTLAGKFAPRGAPEAGPRLALPFIRQPERRRSANAEQQLRHQRRRNRRQCHEGGLEYRQDHQNVERPDQA